MKTRLVLLLLAAALPALPQTAQTTGRVTDPTGSVAPNTRVAAENLDTGLLSPSVNVNVKMSSLLTCQ